MADQTAVAEKPKKQEQEEVNVFKTHTPGVLAVPCTVCRAPDGYPCIQFQPHGAGSEYAASPHRERVLAATHMTEDEAEQYVLEHDITDLEKEGKDLQTKIEDAKKKLADFEKLRAEKEKAAEKSAKK